MSKDFDGKTLTQCFDVVSKCGDELEAMCIALKDLFSESLPVAEAKWIGEEVTDTRTGGAEWVSTDYIRCLSIGPKKNSTKKMYLGYQISLMGDGVAIPGMPAQEPLIHVFLWNDIPSFSNGSYMGFPCDPDQELIVTENRLIEWKLDNGYEWSRRSSAWTFSVRIFAINSREDIRKYVINPAIGLLNGQDVSIALPGDMPGFIRYTNEQLGAHTVIV